MFSTVQQCSRIFLYIVTRTLGGSRSSSTTLIVAVPASAADVPKSVLMSGHSPPTSHSCIFTGEPESQELYPPRVRRPQAVHPHNFGIGP
jgi:hypothetical protein